MGLIASILKILHFSSDSYGQQHKTIVEYKQKIPANKNFPLQAIKFSWTNKSDYHNVLTTSN